MNLSKTLFLGLSLFYTQFAFGYKLEVIYNIKNPGSEEVIKTVTGSGGLTGYEYEGSTLYLISSYNSGSPSPLKVVCKIINTQTLSPIFSMQISQLLSNLSSNQAGMPTIDLQTFSCVNSRLNKPIYEKGVLEITVDPSHGYDVLNFKLKSKPNLSNNYNGITNIIE
jgi:hypothetical protein